MHGWIVFNLPAIIVDTLAEVPFSIQKAYSGERDAEVAGCFAVIAGENSEAATINGEALGNTKLS